MKKSELVKELARVAEIKREEALICLDTYHELLIKQLHDEGKALIEGVGTLKVKERGARIGRNPKTGEEVEIPSHKAVAFSASTSLKHEFEEK